MNHQEKVNYLLNQDPALNKIFRPSIAAGFEKINNNLSPLSTKQLAIVVRLLEILETRPGGPYYNEQRKEDQRLNHALFIFAQGYNIKLSPCQLAIEKSQAITQSAIKLIGRQPKIIEQIKLTAQADSRLEISLLPYFFNCSLQPKYQKLIKPKTIIELGKLNLFYWSAYTLIDDIIDQQRPPQLLPLALEQIRLINEIQLNLKPNQSWLEITNKIIETMNQAQLATPLAVEELGNKSLAHALGPLFILDKLNVDHRPWLKFMQNYLSLRQLHDDITDKDEDQTTNNFNYFNQVLNQNLSQAEIEIGKLAQAAATSLEQITIIKDRCYFLSIIKRYTQPLKETASPKEFLQYYHKLKTN